MAKASEETVSKKQIATKKSDKDNTKNPRKQTIKTHNVAKPKVAAVEEITKEEMEIDQQSTAKAGKRSAKAIKEAELEKVRLEKKEEIVAEVKKPKHNQDPARTRLERRSKNYRKVTELIDKNKSYSVTEALELVKKTSMTKFDATVELHIRLNVDPKQADQNIRGTVALPSGSGKKLRVAVFASADLHDDAKKAGADVVGAEDLLAKFDKGLFDFDTLISTPEMMTKLGKYAKQLGPKGLMPNPKSGTVTKNIVKAITEAKSGKAEYRVDENGIIHLAIGKVSFEVKKLQANLDVILEAITASKPSGIKGAFILSAFLTSSMGPSVRLNA